MATWGRYAAVLLVGLGLLAPSGLVLAQLGKLRPKPAPSPPAPMPAPIGTPVPMPAPVEAAAAPVKPPEAPVPAVRLETIAPPSVNLGKTLPYQIVVRNVGSVPAYQVRVDDHLPPGARFRSADPPPEVQGERLAWNLGELGPGKEIRIRVEVEPSAEGEVHWSATVTYSATADFTTKVTRARLAVTKTGPATAVVGDAVPFEIRIQNTGSGPASGLMIRDELPTGLHHPQASLPRERGEGRVIEAEVGNLAAGETRSITLQTTAAAPGQFTNEVTVTGDGGLQASARAQVTVSQPQLVLRKTGPSQRLLGREAEFDLEVYNPGSAPATGVRVIDTLPEGLEFASASEGATYDGATRQVTWLVGTLPAGQRQGLELRAMGRKVGEWTNKALAQAERIPDATAEATIRLDGIPALLLEVVDLDDPVEVGAETSYEIRVVNQGNCPTTNLQITATVPDGLTLEQAMGPADHQIRGQTVAFDPLPKLGGRADALYRVKVRGIKAGDWRFKVQMTSDQLESPVHEDESTRVYDDEPDRN